VGSLDCIMYSRPYLLVYLLVNPYTYLLSLSDTTIPTCIPTPMPREQEIESAKRAFGFILLLILVVKTIFFVYLVKLYIGCKRVLLMLTSFW